MLLLWLSELGLEVSLWRAQPIRSVEPERYLSLMYELVHTARDTGNRITARPRRASRYPAKYALEDRSVARA